MASAKQSHRDEHKTKISPGRTKAPFLQNKPTEDDAKRNQSARRRCSSFAFAARPLSPFWWGKATGSGSGVLTEQSQQVGAIGFRQIKANPVRGGVLAEQSHR